MVREVGMNIAPAAVLGRINAHDRVAARGYLTIAQLHVMATAQRRCRLTHINADRLTPAGAMFPHTGGGDPGRGQRRRASRSDAEGRRQDRVSAAIKAYFIRLVGGPAEFGQASG